MTFNIGKAVNLGERAMEEKMGRRERKKILSRRAILDSAIAEFSKNGFRETSVADIMNAADLGIGTFYNYFDSKEDILVQILGTMAGDVAAKIEELKAAHRPAREQLAESCSITASFLDQNRYVLPLFLAAADHSGQPEIVAESAAKFAPKPPIKSPGFKTLFEEILREGQASGELRDDVPPELIAEMFHSIYQAAAFSHLGISFTENVAMKTCLLLDGICKGKQS